MQTLALAFLAATALGGVAWVFIYPLLSASGRPNPAAPRSRVPTLRRARPKKASARAASRSRDR